MRPQIILGSRSSRDITEWICGECGNKNSVVQKLVFNVPVWNCANPNCPMTFLADKQTLDFCLGDVKVNGVKLIQTIFNQEDDPICAAMAIYQCMLIGYTVDCILKRKALEPKMLRIDPRVLVRWYDRIYPSLASSTEEYAGNHFFIKSMLHLRSEGHRFSDGSIYRIGDITSIGKNQYEALCEELANGVPLFANITVGSSFDELGYCLIYESPHYKDVIECNQSSFPGHKKHPLHCVVLIGAAFDGEHRGFYFVNSWGLWAPRWVVEDDGSYKKEGGIAKVSDLGLVINPTKLWPPGEGDRRSPDSYEDEDERVNPALWLNNLDSNLVRLLC